MSRRPPLSTSTGLLGRGDLLRALAITDAADMTRVAALLGFDRGQRAKEPSRSAVRAEPPKGSHSVVVEPPTPPPIAPRPLEPARFWQPIRMAKRVELKRETRPIPVERPDWRNKPETAPVQQLLAPWRQLQTRLKILLGANLITPELDIAAIVHAFSRGRQLDPLPHLHRQRWGAPLQLVIDRSDRLVPYWIDQDVVLAILRALVPAHLLQVAISLEGLGEPRLVEPIPAASGYTMPRSGTVVLVLGDLGALDAGGDAAARRWGELGRRLALAGCRPAALLPCPPLRCPQELRKLWHVMPWERPGLPLPQDAASLAARAGRLLRLCAPAVRLEPGLLRAMRHMLGPAEVDAGTEADVWQHAALSSRSPVAATLQPDAARDLRAAFAGEARERQRQALALIKSWRHGLPFEIWAEEVVNLDAASRDLLATPADLDDALAFFAYLGAHGDSAAEGGRAVRAWLGRVATRATDAAREFDEVENALMTARRGDPDYQASTGDPLRIRTDAPERLLELRQQGGRLVAANHGDGRAQGSLLGLLYSANGIVRLAAAEPDATIFWAADRPPSWANAWGRDEHGPWVDFGVPGKAGALSTQRLRWVPPGRFMMGSPSDEDERYADEGPRHEVTFAHGFWMFDTAVTEDLWRIVMDPGRARSSAADQPVTNVSRVTAGMFVARLNELCPGIELALPSEAQWEYACRAGSETAYWFGEEVRPDLINFATQGTRPVRSLPPNPWGLYEVHGNVLEWVQDEWHSNYRGAPDDGSSWLDAPPASAPEPGPGLSRGGSWRNTKRGVRSAFRFGPGPDSRGGVMGLRCVRQPLSEESRRAAVPAHFSPATQDRVGGAAIQPAALRIEPGWPPVTTPLPRLGRLSITTDRDALVLSGIVKPDWASAVGRDRYGLFAEVTIEGRSGAAVTQRLRWIPPGRFRMGSSDGEEERVGVAEPLQEVIIGDGVWLFDTPCTQALWEAVMGAKPDRGVGAFVAEPEIRRVIAFITRIGEIKDGVAFALPRQHHLDYVRANDFNILLLDESLHEWTEDNTDVYDRRESPHPTREVELLLARSHIGFRCCLRAQRDEAVA